MDTFTFIELFLFIGIIFGLLYGLGRYLLKYKKEKKWVQKLSNYKIIYWMLIAWTIGGFFTNLDYTQQWGCIISSEPIFSTYNLVYTGTALFLLTLAILTPSRQIKTSILVGELLFWLYKLFLIKGGYVVGFGGVPSIGVLIFDIVALTLRLALIKQILEMKFKTIFVLFPSFIVMLIKVLFFR